MTPPKTAFVSKLLLLGVLLTPAGALVAQTTPKPVSVAPAKKDEKKDDKKPEDKKPEESRSPITAFIVKRAMTVSGADIAPAVILVQDGKIKEIGKVGEVEVPPFAERIERPDQVVCPGFVHPTSTAFQRAGRVSLISKSLRGATKVAKSLVPTNTESKRLARSGYTTLSVIKLSGGVVGTGALIRPVKVEE